VPQRIPKELQLSDFVLVLNHDVCDGRIVVDGHADRGPLYQLLPLLGFVGFDFGGVLVVARRVRLGQQWLDARARSGFQV
jgi:hypothetical protein